MADFNNEAIYCCTGYKVEVSRTVLGNKPTRFPFTLLRLEVERMRTISLATTATKRGRAGGVVCEGRVKGHSSVTQPSSLSKKSQLPPAFGEEGGGDRWEVTGQEAPRVPNTAGRPCFLPLVLCGRWTLLVVLYGSTSTMPMRLQCGRGSRSLVLESRHDQGY